MRLSNRLGDGRIEIAGQIAGWSRSPQPVFEKVCERDLFFAKATAKYIDWRLRIGVERGDAGKVGGIGIEILRPADRVVLSKGTIGSNEYRVG